MTADVRNVHQAIHALLSVHGARAVLDLGCGRGEDLIELSRAGATDCRLVGLDSAAASIEAARQSAAGDRRLEFALHDVTRRLPFDDGEFDRVLSVNLLETIPDKSSFLREVHRVLRANGRLVLAHWDWDSQLFDGEDKALVRRVVHAFADWKQAWMADADGWMGRRLWKTVQSTGLFDGTIHAIVHTSTCYEPSCYGYRRAQDFRSLAQRGLISAEDDAAMRAGLERLAQAGQYFYSITMFVYLGVPR